MQAVTAVTRVLTAATAARLANEAAAVAVVLHLVARTDDAALAGLVVAAFALPTLVTGPILGAHLDRLAAPRALFVANQAVLAGALTGILLLAGHAPGAVLVALGLLAGVTAPVLTGGFSTLLPRVARGDRLPRVNAADAVSYDLAGIAGPALVAAMAGLAGAAPALAAAAAVAAAGVALATLAPMPPPAVAARPERLAAAVRDGTALLWRLPALRATTVSTTVGHGATGLLPVTFPLLAVEFGHPTAHGAWLLTALSAGSLVGAAASARLLRRFPPPSVLAASLAGLGAALGAAALAPNLPVALALAAAGGVAEGPVLAATLAVRQRCVPDGRYGQVVATAASLKVGAYALGAAATGLLTAAVAPRGVLLLVALAQLAATVPLLLLRPGDTLAGTDPSPAPAAPADRPAGHA